MTVLLAAFGIAWIGYACTVLVLSYRLPDRSGAGLMLVHVCAKLAVGFLALLAAVDESRRSLLVSLMTAIFIADLGFTYVVGRRSG